MAMRPVARKAEHDGGYYESLRLSQHEWPCGPSHERLSMMGVYYEIMKPFEKKWACYNAPMKAAQPNGYDVIMASGMLGFLLPEKIDETWTESITLLGDNQFWDNCQKSIARSLKCFIDAKIELPIKEYLYTILLADPENPYMIMNDNYCGDGGIPGYIFTWLVPSEHTQSRLPVALAHETNHNVRFQFIKWHNDITLADRIGSGMIF